MIIHVIKAIITISLKQSGARNALSGLIQKVSGAFSATLGKAENIWNVPFDVLIKQSQSVPEWFTVGGTKHHFWNILCSEIKCARSHFGNVILNYDMTKYTAVPILIVFLHWVILMALPHCLSVIFVDWFKITLVMGKGKRANHCRLLPISWSKKVQMFCRE